MINKDKKREQSKNQQKAKLKYDNLTYINNGFFGLCHVRDDSIRQHKKDEVPVRNKSPSGLREANSFVFCLNAKNKHKEKQTNMILGRSFTWCKLFILLMFVYDKNKDTPLWVGSITNGWAYNKVFHCLVIALA